MNGDRGVPAGNGSGDSAAESAPVADRLDHSAAAGPVRANASATDVAGEHWHALDGDEVLRRLRTTREGLREEEAKERLTRHGPNLLRPARPVSVLKLLLDQLRSLVVLLLFIAALVALAIGDRVEALAIAAVLLINTALGFGTELRARREMEALLRYEVPRTRVIREGSSREIDAAEVVPGDILQVEAGEAIPADARLIEASELRTNEAALTGESLPVGKRADLVLAHDTPLAERANLLHKGTTLVAGSGRGVAIATGMATGIGRIGELVETIVEEEAPLERRLDALGRRLVWITLAVAVVVAGMGMARGYPLGTMIETAIALAIAAVPEGLPAVATIALAVGLRRMARRQALVRRLPAVEALGSTTVVCTDKTGTLTAGEMMASVFWLADREIHVSGFGFAPDGEFTEGGRPVTPGDEPALQLALRTAVLASRSELVRKADTWTVTGDPTDGALVVAGRKGGLERERLIAEAPQVAELPFSSERRLLVSFHEENGARVAYVKGAPGRLLELSSRWLSPEGEADLDEAARARILERNEALASRGLRVLGLASGSVREPREEALHGLVFIGLVGLMDPPAEEVEQTIETFQTAGIRTIMITGDQRRTAEAIARELGVLGEGMEAMDGRDLEQLSDAELDRRMAGVGVFSRVSPADKLKIVAALQRRGEIVAMLGDGVNDAAALKKADVGVAMGIRGTDVAKETADIVLQDDRFATIAAAVEEGRVIFDNIRKFIFYLFSCNLAEVLVLVVASVAGMPLPLLPLQILWLNLVTDTFPALALAMEPAEGRVMRRPPRDPEAAILSRGFVRSIAFYAALITLSTLTAFWWALETSGYDANRAVTISFMTLALAQLFHLGNARSDEPVLAWKRVTANRYALAAVGIVFVLQLAAVYWAPLAHLLRVSPLTAAEWLVVAPLALAPAVAGQLLRWTRSRRAVGLAGAA